MSIRTYFENIATAIKTKNPNVTTVTPANMPDAILNIPSGGGNLYDEPIHYDDPNHYCSSGTVRYSVNGARSDIYKLKADHVYLFFRYPAAYFGEYKISDNRFRCVVTSNDPYTATATVNGENALNLDADITPSFINLKQPQYYVGAYANGSSDAYLTIQKTNNYTVTGLKIFVIDLTETIGGAL